MGGFSGILPEAKLMWKLEGEGSKADGSKAVNNLLQGLGEYNGSRCCWLLLTKSNGGASGYR